jgi:hypothetical protein
MDLKAVQDLYRDALSFHLKNMGLQEDIADFEAKRIAHRWISKE